MNTEHNPSLHWGRSQPLAGSTTHHQELCHHAKCHWPLRAAAPFLTSACALPSLQFSRGKVWYKCVCSAWGSAAAVWVVISPAQHSTGHGQVLHKCQGQPLSRAPTQAAAPPHHQCCLLRTINTFIVTMAPHLFMEAFCKTQDFEFATTFVVWSCSPGAGYQVTPTVSSGKESSVAFCLVRQEFLAQAPLSYLPGFLSCESSTVELKGSC